MVFSLDTIRVFPMAGLSGEARAQVDLSADPALSMPP
jgi:hypothetical protein